MVSAGCCIKPLSAYGYVIGDHQSLTALLQPLTSVDVSSSSASSYLDHLQSLPLPELLRQPSLISIETSTVESDLTNLCFREYPTFISVHKCSSAVKSAFDDFSDSLEKLIGSVPALEDECQTFSSSTSKIQRIRNKASLVQEHQDKLLDLLEIPQLMETCVRNGYYQEAMELLDHSRTISQRYKDVVLVQDVVREVEGVLQLMLTQLLSLLREPIKLPPLIKTVTFLRRLHALDENELALVFISSRYRNFRAQLAYIERDKADPVRYLRRYVDLFREHVYDLIAQFTTDSRLSQPPVLLKNAPKVRDAHTASLCAINPNGRTTASNSYNPSTTTRHPDKPPRTLRTTPLRCRNFRSHRNNQTLGHLPSNIYH